MEDIHCCLCMNIHAFFKGFNQLLIISYMSKNTQFNL